VLRKEEKKKCSDSSLERYPPPALTSHTYPSPAAGIPSFRVPEQSQRQVVTEGRCKCLDQVERFDDRLDGRKFGEMKSGSGRYAPQNQLLGFGWIIGSISD